MKPTPPKPKIEMWIVENPDGKILGFFHDELAANSYIAWRGEPGLKVSLQNLEESSIRWREQQKVL